MPLSAERKAEYFVKMEELLLAYSKCFIVGVDNVGSSQLQTTRRALRGKAEVLMGKNTMMRKVIRDYAEKNPGTPIEQLIKCCQGNVGFVFTNGDLGEIRQTIEANTRPAPARVGSLAPVDVVVPKGPTGCDPGQTAFFQALQISTKISRGSIEIVNDVDLIKKAEKVTASQAALLQKLNIEPFTYGLTLKSVYDSGSLFEASVLDMTEDVLAAGFFNALNTIAALSLVLGHPTQASVPHSMANAFKAVVSIVVGLDNYSFETAEVYKEYLKDPSKFASASGGGGGGGGETAAVVEEKPEEVEEEMDMSGGISMFGEEEAAGGGDY